MDIFDRSGSDHSLKPLDQSELSALEAILFEKNERLYFRCPVRNKDLLAKPEEAVRQLWILRLTKHYGYPLKRLAVEYPITFGRDTSKRAHIVMRWSRHLGQVVKLGSPCLEDGPDDGQAEAVFG